MSEHSEEIMTEETGHKILVAVTAIETILTGVLDVDKDAIKTRRDDTPETITT